MSVWIIKICLSEKPMQVHLRMLFRGQKVLDPYQVRVPVESVTLVVV